MQDNVKIIDLGYAKELQCKKSFLEAIKTNSNYDENDVPLLAYGVGCLALNIARCSNYLIKRSSSRQEGLSILRDIFDGKVGENAYEMLFRAGKIKEQSIKADQFLMKLYSKDEVKLKKSLRLVEAMPENFESKKYYNDYLDFCRGIATEVSLCVIEKCEEEFRGELSSKAINSAVPAKRVRFLK